MKTLHEIYGLNVTDVRYRGKLKSRIENKYKNRILFLQPQKNIPLVLINANISLSEINFTNNKECIVKSAEYLREDIIRYSENLPELSWPPTSNELSSDEHSTMPASLITFLNHLLKSSDKHAITRSSNAVRLVNPCASDMIHGVTRGKVITAKHFLLALGLHIITGQKKPIQICNILGHCISYDLAMDIETAGLDKSCTCVRGVLENIKFSYLRTPYILYVHDHHLSSLLVREETLKSSRMCLLHRRCSCQPCCFEEIRTTADK